VPLPLKLLTRRAGPVGLVLTAYDIWRRLPPKQRKRLVAEARKQGPRIASAAYERTRRQPRPPRP
jgi:hypothetical protein